MTAKQAIQAELEHYPDDATVADILGGLAARFGVTAATDGEVGEWSHEPDSEWVAEINRRVADLASGEAVAIPHEEVMRQMREKYG